MAAQNRPARLGLAVTLEAAPAERGIRIVITPVDDAEKLVSVRFSLVVNVWREGPAVVRGSITHSSGAVAYFQGSETLVRMAQTLGIGLESCE